MSIGDTSELDEPRGWLSGDGEDWLALKDGQALAVMPVLVPFEPGMLVKSMEGSADTETPEIPQAFYGSTAPNPFNPVLTVSYGLPRSAHVKIAVYDVRGRRVAVLQDGHKTAGHHQLRWAATDDRDRGVASGVYVVAITAGDDSVTRRVTLLK